MSGVYGALTEYLGFEMLDGEYKVMGMAPYGDPAALRPSSPDHAVAEAVRGQHRYVNTVGLRRHKTASGFYFSDKLIDWLGPRAGRDRAMSPTVTTRRPCRSCSRTGACKLMDTYLGDALRATGRLAFAGGGALNVKLNQRILARDDVQRAVRATRGR